MFCYVELFFLKLVEIEFINGSNTLFTEEFAKIIVLFFYTSLVQMECIKSFYKNMIFKK